MWHYCCLQEKRQPVMHKEVMITMVKNDDNNILFKRPVPICVNATQENSNKNSNLKEKFKNNVLLEKQLSVTLT